MIVETVVVAGIIVLVKPDLLTVVIACGVPCVGVDIFVAVNANMLAGVTCVMPATLEGFSCSAAFDCRPIIFSPNRDRVLQAWIPSYHVR